MATELKGIAGSVEKLVNLLTLTILNDQWVGVRRAGVPVVAVPEPDAEPDTVDELDAEVVYEPEDNDMDIVILTEENYDEEYY